MTGSPEPTSIQPPALSPVERAATIVLRSGVTASVALIALGLLVSLLRHPSALGDADFLSRLTSGESVYPTTLRTLAGELAELRGRAVVTLGLLLLIATPLLRVVVSLLAFLREHDWLYAALTLLVLAVLTASFLAGRAA